METQQTGAIKPAADSIPLNEQPQDSGFFRSVDDVLAYYTGVNAEEDGHSPSN